MKNTASWPLSLSALAAACALILGAYWPTAAGMFEIWMRSGTYTHALLVPPITLWLVWRLRQYLRPFMPQPTPWLAVPLLAIATVWLFGELVAINVVTQFALVAMLVVCVPMLLGWPLTRALVFPLMFLFFCVPFGEFIMPQLMQWTADITVIGVRLSGVPVYQEGLQFIIPSGRWSVVEACSGIRYLIASVCVGTVFAYLNYSSLKRRILFILAAAIVPLIANWLRAYGIVMLGHVSGNALATGVDHLVYGWVFFGIVITLLFMVGMRWQQAERLPQYAPWNSNERTHSLLLVWLLLAAVVLLPKGALWLIERGNLNTTPLVHSASLQSIADWQGQTTSFNGWRPAFTTPAVSWQRSYRRGEQQAAIYIAYYRQQDSQRKLISSSNTLVRSDDKEWAMVERGSSQVGDLSVRSATVRGGDVGASSERRLRVWQWYWVDGEMTASDIKGKLLTLKSRLSGRGDDGAIVVVYAPEEQPGGAEAALAAFAPLAQTALAEALAQTREQR
jgi:exosortase A